MRNVLVVIFFVGAHLIVDIANASEEVYSQKERDQFRAIAEKGCVENQSSEVSNAYILPIVIEESCRCYANKATSSVFGSMEFQLAWSRKDGEKIRRITSQIITPDKASEILHSCLQLSMDQRGGESKIVIDTPYSSSMTKIGLKGVQRRSFVNAGLRTCREDNQKFPENMRLSEDVLETFCVCIMNYSADRVSNADSIDFMKGLPSATKKFEKLTEASTKYCVEKLIGKKTNISTKPK